MHPKQCWYETNAPKGFTGKAKGKRMTMLAAICTEGIVAWMLINGSVTQLLWCFFIK